MRPNANEKSESTPSNAERRQNLSTEAPAQRNLPPLSELEQLVTAERLREIIWDERSRPSLQWIRKETKRRMLPHIRRGRLVFYRPKSVMEWYSQRESRPASMK